MPRPGKNVLASPAAPRKTPHGEAVARLRESLQAPEELIGLLEPMLSNLATLGLERLEVFRNCRPGEPEYWLAFLFAGGRRRSLGTPDLRHLPLDEQVPELIRQLENFNPHQVALFD